MPSYHLVHLISRVSQYMSGMSECEHLFRQFFLPEFFIWFEHVSLPNHCSDSSCSDVSHVDPCITTRESAVFVVDPVSSVVLIAVPASQQCIIHSIAASSGATDLCVMACSVLHMAWHVHLHCRRGESFAFSPAPAARLLAHNPLAHTPSTYLQVLASPGGASL